MYAESAWSAELRDRFFEAGLRRLGLELAWAPHDQEVAVDAYLSALQVELLRLYRHVRLNTRVHRSRHSELVTRFRELVESHFRETHMIETYAGWLGVTARQLRDACVAATARRPTEIINERLGLEAGCIMSYSDRSITNVGWHLGFDDPSHFSRIFSKVFALSPRWFRSEVQKGSTVHCGKAH